VSQRSETDVRTRAGWLPPSPDRLEEWIRGRASSAADGDGPLHPAVEAYRELIDGDPVLRMHAHQMIEQVPSGRDYRERHLESVEQMLRLIDELLRTAPEFSSDSMVMLPFAAILDWTIATPAGFAFYRDPRVNDALRGILDAWCAFLTSRDSLDVLTDSPDGWMGDAAREAIGIERYQHDPDDPHWGFTSWNDFFTRRFREGERPVASPEDPLVIASPCEATPYRIASRVARRDDFWAKSEVYSLDEMLGGDPSVDALEGGTVFQAFLSALEYHRWHAPVSGRVVSARVIPGTYFSEADAQGAAAAEPTVSQGYIAHVATRAVIVIEADEPAIGLVAVVFIGMVDVSSCMVAESVVPDARVEKGDELGFFQYGGSTVCVAFQPGVVEAFALEAIPQAEDETATLLRVRAHLATARRR
jgi:phosphatidylserine decarboxylase